MLKKSNISSIVIHSEEWHQGRLAKFTSSNIYLLMGDKWPTEGALSYIYRKVGEEISGLPSRDETSNEATRHGLHYEKEALVKFCQKMGVDYLVTQKLIYGEHPRTSSTPDGLIIDGEGRLRNGYNVCTVECKCPYAYDAYMQLFVCKTPEDVKKVSKPYFWQVVDQMDVCDAMKGYFFCYQPFFKAGQMNIVTFRKIKMVNDFKLLRERKKLAIEMFEQLRDQVINSK